MIDLEKKIEEFDDFPTLPTVYTKLLELLSDNSTTIKDIANLISKDVSLSVKLLKIVNSTMYGLNTTVKSVDKAIFHLGFREIKNLVMTTQVIEIFSNLKSVKKLNIVEFWKHSIAVGIVSRQISKSLGYKNLDEYLLSGLVHDMGKLVLIKILSSDYDKVLSENEKKQDSLIETENELLGISHTDVGARLAEAWDMDKSIIDVIKNHHKKTNDLMTSIVQCSNTIVHLFEYGYSGEVIVPKTNSTIWNQFSLNNIDLNKLYKSIKEEYNQAIRILILN